LIITVVFDLVVYFSLENGSASNVAVRHINGKIFVVPITIVRGLLWNWHNSTSFKSKAMSWRNF